MARVLADRPTIGLARLGFLGLLLRVALAYGAKKFRLAVILVHHDGGRWTIAMHYTMGVALWFAFAVAQRQDGAGVVHHGNIAARGKQPLMQQVVMHALVVACHVVAGGERLKVTAQDIKIAEHGGCCAHRGAGARNGLVAQRLPCVISKVPCHPAGHVGAGAYGHALVFKRDGKVAGPGVRGGVGLEDDITHIGQQHLGMRWCLCVQVVALMDIPF